MQISGPRIKRMEMRGIVKQFPGVLANDRVNFDVEAGEIHALLGENGAGKSTLMRVLYGMYHPDEGEILIDGVRQEIYSPLDAIHLGIGMVHQHFMLVESLTVKENVALGLASSRGMLTDLDRVAVRIVELAGLYGLQVDPNAYIRELSVGQQQRVEIIKSLYRGASLLILDEPTAVLTPQEVNEFFAIVQQMASQGHALIFISHKLNEVMAFTNRVTVLRDGRNVGTVLTPETNKKQLAQMMVGRELKLVPEHPKVPIGDVRLRLENVSATRRNGSLALDRVSLEVRGGEILGIAGVSGNGQRELAEVIAGMYSVSSGEIYIDNARITNKSTGKVMEHGLAYIPEERNRDGMIKEFTIAENLILRESGKYPFVQSGLLNFRAIRRHGNKLVENFNIKTPTLETPIKNLSGGNAQKVILARELSRVPAVLIAAQPTRGLDIGATEYVRERIVKQREEGTATLLISEDLDEILALSDRIAVMYEGRIMDVVNRADTTPEQLGLLMAGAQAKAVD